MKIMFVGDLNLGEYYTSFGNGPGTFARKKSVFSNVIETFRQADFIVGNLEAAITDKNNDPDDPERMVLKVEPSNAYQLTDAGFKVLQIANNHTVQHGPEAFNQCVNILKDLSIEPVGLQRQEPVVIQKDGVSFGFLAASDVPDNTDKAQNLYQRLDDEFLEIVRRTVNDVDHMIVMLHWGLEESTVPLPYQRELARKLKELGVRAIIGSHTHLFYEIESNNNFVCAYSLGNFVFDLCWDKRLTRSGILELEFTKSSISGRVWPVTLEKNGCLPTISGSPVPLSGNVTLYDHGDSLKWQQTRKVVYLVSNIMKGNTRLKSIFFKRKFLRWRKR